MNINRKIIIISICLMALIGCNKTKEDTSVKENTKNQVLNKPDPTYRVQEFFKSRYKKYNEQHQCYVRVFGAGTYCVTLKVIATNDINNGELMYVVESGSPLEKDGSLANYHISTGLVTLFLIEDINNQIKVIAESEEINNGFFGTPNQVKTYRAGSDGQLGWILEDAYGNMGNIAGGISLYLQKDNKITEVASLSTFAGNAGACGDAKDQICDLSDINTVVEAVYAKNKKYFDLKVSTKMFTKEMGKAAVNTDIVKVIPFNDQKFTYDLEEVNKPYRSQ
jgi:hypothetical protein